MTYNDDYEVELTIKAKFKTLSNLYDLAMWGFDGECDNFDDDTDKMYREAFDWFETIIGDLMEEMKEVKVNEMEM